MTNWCFIFLFLLHNSNIYLCKMNIGSLFIGDANDAAYNANNKLHQQSLVIRTSEASSVFLAAVVQFPCATAAVGAAVTPPSKGVSSEYSLHLLHLNLRVAALSHPTPAPGLSSPPPSAPPPLPTASKLTWISWEVVPRIPSKTECGVHAHAHSTAHEKCTHTRLLRYCTSCFVR